ncbi:hypothetical protein ACOSQ4_023811 [Xanthoceras sorbifolium]
MTDKFCLQGLLIHGPAYRIMWFDLSLSLSQSGNSIGNCELNLNPPSIVCQSLYLHSVWSTFFGVIEWGDGYYNGDIKTRKTVPAMELKADKIGLERSQQLRELYESLLEGETEQVNKRPSAAFSPEDLTDAE